jgi:hypothetical protein
MENQDLNLFSLGIDDTSKTTIKSIVSWVTVLVICNLIGLVITIYEFLKPAPKTVLSESGYSYKPVQSGENIIGVALGFIITIILLVFLYNFIRYAKQGVERSNMSDISKGFLNLKNYFLVIGILIILMILLLLVALTLVGSM